MGSHPASSGPRPAARLRPAAALGVATLTASMLAGCGVLPGLPDTSAPRPPAAAADSPSPADGTAAPAPSASSATTSSAPSAPATNAPTAPDPIGVMNLTPDRPVPDTPGFLKRVQDATRRAGSYRITITGLGKDNVSVVGAVDLAQASTPKVQMTAFSVDKPAERMKVVRIGDRVWVETHDGSHHQGSYGQLDKSIRRLMEALASPLSEPAADPDLRLYFSTRSQYGEDVTYLFRAGTFTDPTSLDSSQNHDLVSVDDHMRLTGYSQWRKGQMGMGITLTDFGDITPIEPLA